MQPLRCCTLTGVDENTNLSEWLKVAEAYPIAEWGVLHSRARMGEDAGKGRYPRLGWIKDFVDMAKDHEMRIALHLCGQDAIDFVRQDDKVWELASRFDRVQLNVRAKRLEIDGIGAEQLGKVFHSFHFSHGFGRVILQDNEANAALCEELVWKTKALDCLIDASGGRGILPDEWPSLREKRGKFGFAGGIGPDNVREELERIALVSDSKPFWISQESKLRDGNDRFDLEACRAVLDKTSLFLVERIVESGRNVTVMQNHGDDEHEDYQPTPPPRKVQDLTGFWLDWYAGVVTGRKMVMPPENASRAMFMHRGEGEFFGFNPTGLAHDHAEVMEGSEVGCVKDQGVWFGVTQDGSRVSGKNRQDAELKGAVLEALGPDLPQNPGHLEAVVANWVGHDFTKEVLPQVIAEGSRRLRP